jgi:rhodanese-related sulfurtransferase
MAESPHKIALYEQFARIGRALASPKRLELLDLLAQSERSVEALAVAAGLGVTTTSAHLQTLRHAQLVATRRDGTKIYYRLAGEDVARHYAGLRDLAHARLAEVSVARRAYLGEDVEEITREELLRRAEAGDVIVLDVRPAEEHAAGHIPGALSIPVDQLAARIAELPADAEVVAYCRGEYCVLAHDAVRVLRAAGRGARKLEQGMLEWRLAGLSVQA